jgi:hypothetical protein
LPHTHFIEHLVGVGADPKNCSRRFTGNMTYC